MTILIATVVRVSRSSLLVRDATHNQEILVHTREADRFRPGDRVRITYDGKMTMSIPPQITAISVRHMDAGVHPPAPCPPSAAPAEMRAVILRRTRTALLVRDLQSGRQIQVRYAFAHHFCVGQRVIVRHDRITMTNPPSVEATDVAPIC